MRSRSYSKKKTVLIQAKAKIFHLKQLISKLNYTILYKFFIQIYNFSIIYCLLFQLHCHNMTLFYDDYMFCIKGAQYPHLGVHENTLYVWIWMTIETFLKNYCHILCKKSHNRYDEFYYYKTSSNTICGFQSVSLPVSL